MFYSKRLKKFKRIKHCFFSRKGGFSKGIYSSLNCGKGSKDNKKKINQNLNYVAKKMDVALNNLVLMHQTHSNKVEIIKKNKSKKRIFSDALITSNKRIALGVLTADCVPILIYDDKNEIVACIHAGWKGALSNIIKKTIHKIKKISKKNKIYASVGPCIGKASYEVEKDFYEKFIFKSKKNKIYFSIKNKTKKLFNLRKFVSDKLKELNISVDHVNRDTFREKNNFFSYRRSSIDKHPDYGRCISVIRLV